MEPPWVGRTKVPPNDLIYMTKMASTPIYSRTLQIPFSPRLVGLLVKCIATWYIALTTQAHHSLFKL